MTLASPSSVEVVTAPATAIVSIEDAARYLGAIHVLDSTADRALLQARLDAAVDSIEGIDSITGTAFRETGFRTIVEAPNACPVQLVGGDVSDSGISIEIVAPDGTVSPLTDYEVLRVGRYVTWICTDVYTLELRISYTAQVTPIPRLVKEAILRMLGALWHGREAGGEGTPISAALRDVRPMVGPWVTISEFD